MGKIYKPKRRKHQTTHGFLIRGQGPGGRRILRARRRKQRRRLSA